MKVGIVGAGAVGSACCFAMALRGSVRQLVLVNRSRARADGVVADINYGVALGRRISLESGDYEDLAGCDVVVITAGINERGGGATDRGDPEGRLRLLKKNAGVYHEMLPKIAAAAREAILLVVTDPPDALADVARRLVPDHQVIGSGTYLDSLRFRFHLGAALSVDPRSVNASIIGEHGTSQVFLWTMVSVGGVRLPAAVPPGTDIPAFQRQVEDAVRYANIDIIEGTGASQYGIGIVVARIVEAIANDEQIVIPIASFQQRYGVTFSLPSRVGKDGVMQVFTPDMSAEESNALDVSAAALRRAREDVR